MRVWSKDRYEAIGTRQKQNHVCKEVAHPTPAMGTGGKRNWGTGI